MDGVEMQTRGEGDGGRREEADGGKGGGKGGWMDGMSVSALLKHSCLLCWSPRDKSSLEQDERVIQKTSQIRDLEDAVQVEGIELQEQNADRRELELTLERLDKHRAELVEQIKLTRQQCCEESQQILSLQAEEVQKETTVEEYERELQRVRLKLRRLREEVRSARRKVEEAGERTGPLQESISQSYEEILEEEKTLRVLSGERTADAALSPDLQQGEVEDTSPPSCTTEEVPLRPWGRSQSLPAYADVILRRCGSSSITNNPLSEREEEDGQDVTGPSTPKIITSQDWEEEEEEEEKEEKQTAHQVRTSSIAINELDFYHPDPFVHCEREHDLFKDDLFAKPDQSDVFADDPFKGTDPFAADILFAEGSEVAFPPTKPLADPSSSLEAGLNDSVDTSLSCAENKASTGTQCFESEFPDEDESSDIEISYSREDLDTVATGADDDTATASFPNTQSFDITQRLGFKPIQARQTASLDTQQGDLPDPEGFEPLVLGLEPGAGTRASTWAAQPNYSTESDPNGYEFDINAVSPPSDIEEVSLGSIPASYDSVVQSPPFPDPGFDTAIDVLNVCEFQKRPDVEQEEEEKEEEKREEEEEEEEDKKEEEEADDVEEEAGPGHAAAPEPADHEPRCGADLADVTSSHGARRSDSERRDDAAGLDGRSGSHQRNGTFSFGADSLEFSYEAAGSHASFDPYGFKLSPEHSSSQELLDPDASLQPDLDPATFHPYDFQPSSQPDDDDGTSFDPYATFQPDLVDPYESQPNDDGGVTFDPYGFNLATRPPSDPGATFDPYGFKLSPETDNQLLQLGASVEEPGRAPETNNNNLVRPPTPPRPPRRRLRCEAMAISALLGLELSNAAASSDRAPVPPPVAVVNPSPARAPSTSATTNMAAGAGCELRGEELDVVFGTGGYVACPDVADDLEPFESTLTNPADPRHDNQAFRGRQTSQSESLDSAADWMTVRSNSKELFGAVDPRKCNLDK